MSVFYRRLLLACLITITAGLAACSQSSDETAVAPEVAGTPAAEQDSLVATTQYGKVRGMEEDGVKVFKGIRYGADTATTRFMAPKAPEAWEGIKDAMAYGNSTRQIPTGSGGGLFDSWRPDPVPPLSEDCLFLNVWTPELRDGGKRPVMVWFHGGGFTSGNGSSNAYDGVRLANRGDVVVVTVNHRLNIFGYTYLGDYGDQFADSGVAGQLDLIHSLKWVRDNIEEFGGDPDNVLIFGESGGGAKVSVLMGMSAAEGLFHRAVIQSGPTITLRDTKAVAEGVQGLVAKLGLTAETIDQIRTMPAEKIEQAAWALAEEGSPTGWSGPVLDGKNITRHPFTPDAAPYAADVPLLIGTTRTEYSLLTGSRRPELFDLSYEELPAALSPTAQNKDTAHIVAEYRRLQPDYTAPELFFTATTDAGFLNRSIELADRKAEQAGAPVYFYSLWWNTPVDGGKWMAPHALEIGMVFDNVAKSESMSGIGPEQQKIADEMSEAWLAFAKTGNPNHAGIPEWPAYSPDNRAMMIFNNETSVMIDPHGEQRQLFLDDE
jgi:para-nitrobenzyl esterase